MSTGRTPPQPGRERLPQHGRVRERQIQCRRTETARSAPAHRPTTPAPAPPQPEAAASGRGPVARSRERDGRRLRISCLVASRPRLRTPDSSPAPVPRVPARLLLLIVPQTLHVIFQDGHALRQRELSSRKWEMITEKRKNMTRNTRARDQKQRQRRIRHAVQRRVMASSTGRLRESSSMARGGQQPAHRILHADVRAPHRNQHHAASSKTLRTVVTFKRRSIYPPAAGAAGAARRTSRRSRRSIFQDVHENAQQHVGDVIQRFARR